MGIWPVAAAKCVFRPQLKRFAKLLPTPNPKPKIQDKAEARDPNRCVSGFGFPISFGLRVSKSFRLRLQFQFRCLAAALRSSLAALLLFFELLNLAFQPFHFLSEVLASLA